MINREPTHVDVPRTNPLHRVFVLPPADVRNRSELVTAEDLACWLDQQLLEGWELVSFGPQTWRPGSKDTVWIFRRKAL